LRLPAPALAGGRASPRPRLLLRRSGTALLLLRRPDRLGPPPPVGSSRCGVRGGGLRGGGGQARGGGVLAAAERAVACAAAAAADQRQWRLGRARLGIRPPARPFPFLYGGPLCRGPRSRALGKDFFYFFYLISLPRANIQGPRQRCFLFYFRRRHPVQNICRGPVQRALGKEFYFFISKFFAEGLTPSPRQRLTAGAAVTLGRGRREAVLCRGPGPRQRWAFAVGR